MPLTNDAKKDITTRNVLIQAFYEARTAHQQYPDAPWNKKTNSMPTLFKNLSLFQQSTYARSFLAEFAKCEAQKWDSDGEIKRVGKLLQDYDNPNFYEFIVDYVKSSGSNWNIQDESNDGAMETTKFASYFLHRLRVISPMVFKSIIHDAFEIVFLDAQSGQDTVILYRWDKRPYEKIFSDGFSEREAFRPMQMQYAARMTGMNGVSTSSLLSVCFNEHYAAGNGVYVIEINAIELDQQFIIVDIDATLKAQGQEERGIREMNAITAIPGRCIRELIPYNWPVLSGAFIPNPKFSLVNYSCLDTRPRDEDGFLIITPEFVRIDDTANTFNAAAATASVNSSRAAETASPTLTGVTSASNGISPIAAAAVFSSSTHTNSTVINTQTSATARPSLVVASSSYINSLTTSSSLVANSFMQPPVATAAAATAVSTQTAIATFTYRNRTVKVERGRQKVQIVFQGYHDAKHFINEHQLCSDQNATQPKKIEAHPGRNIVRVTTEVFDQLKTTIPELASAPTLAN